MPSTNNPNNSNNLNVIELSDSEKDQVLELWDSGVYDVKALVNAIFPGKDGRSKEGVAVKTFLTSKNLKPKVTSEYEKKEITLDEDQKQFIEAQAGSHKPLEITRLLFKNDKLTNLSVEGRAVMAYYATIDPKMRFIQADEEGGSELSEYKPPRNLSEAITKVKKYLFDVVDDINKLTQKRRDELSFLVKFLNTHRYVHSMNKLGGEQERILFESEFVRFVHDKPDLTQEDVDLYINYCGDIVSHNRMIDEEKQIRQALLEDDGIEEGGKKKLSMALVQHLSELRKDIGANLTRQKKTLDDLNSKRTDRRAALRQENASVLNFVEAWKDKGKRERLIRQQLLRKQLIRKEVDRLSTMEGVMYEIYGVGEEEVLG